MFCGSRAEVVSRQFFFQTLSSVYYSHGLNFAKIFTPWSCLHWVLWLQSRSCFTAIFVTWLCRACIGTRGLISLSLLTPWSCLHCIFWLQSRSCFTAIFVIWLCRACVRTRGLIFVNLITPRSYLQFVWGIVAPAEVVSRQFLLPLSVVRFI